MFCERVGGWFEQTRLLTLEWGSQPEAIRILFVAFAGGKPNFECSNHVYFLFYFSHVNVCVRMLPRASASVIVLALLHPSTDGIRVSVGGLMQGN
jgi:hypothetical protein